VLIFGVILDPKVAALEIEKLLSPTADIDMFKELPLVAWRATG
jgi:hypothetical protein